MVHAPRALAAAEGDGGAPMKVDAARRARLREIYASTEPKGLQELGEMLGAVPELLDDLAELETCVERQRVLIRDLHEDVRHLERNGRDMARDLEHAVRRLVDAGAEW